MALATGMVVIGCGEHANLDSAGFFRGSTEGEPVPPSSPDDSGEPGKVNGSATAGALTAGIWDDNLNFDVFTAYLGETANVKGIPSISLAEQTAAREKFEQRGFKRSVDILLLLDTTGSMYDELDYLIAEFESLSTNIQNTFCRSGIDIRWGLVAYGDEGDHYVVHTNGFAQSADAFEQELRELQRTSGGDYPEAAAEGFDAATQLPWRTGDDVGRLIFWVADAPHHINKTPMIEEAIRRSMRDDIHIYPVAASGLDERTEKIMRTSAQVTGGRYIFLTDDSGIGDTHKEPRIPCYYVTSLKTAIERSVVAEIRGQLEEPYSADIIRTGGDPQNGQCTLQDGSQVIVF